MENIIRNRQEHSKSIWANTFMKMMILWRERESKTGESHSDCLRRTITLTALFRRVGDDVAWNSQFAYFRIVELLFWTSKEVPS